MQNDRTTLFEQARRDKAAPVRGDLGASNQFSRFYFPRKLRRLLGLVIICNSAMFTSKIRNLEGLNYIPGKGRSLAGHAADDDLKLGELCDAEQVEAEAERGHKRPGDRHHCPPESAVLGC